MDPKELRRLIALRDSPPATRPASQATEAEHQPPARPMRRPYRGARSNGAGVCMLLASCLAWFMALVSLASSFEVAMGLAVLALFLTGLVFYFLGER